MSEKVWRRPAVLGGLAGLVAALAMTLVMWALRATLGISPPPEMIPDRLAPLMPLGFFFGLLHLVGGYNQLKQIGIGSVMLGQIAVGIGLGIGYAAVVARARAGGEKRSILFGLSRRGTVFVAVAIGLLWAVTIAVVWPVLGTSYRGWPQDTGAAATTLALLAAYLTFGLGVTLAYGWLARRMHARISTGAAESVGAAPVGRRAALIGGVGLVLAVANGALLRSLGQRAVFAYDGLRYQGPDIQPITPNERFYVVTKNVIDPNVNRSAWRLEIAGLVERRQTLRFEDLAALPASVQQTTLTCISNEVGDGLMSNAQWRGVPFRIVLDAAGVRPGAVEVLLRGVDGYTDTFAIEKALDPATLLAFEMNGQPLPERHGYPVRLIVPGLYGEKNVKWLTRVEVIDQDGKGFYEMQGWGPSFVVKTQSRFHGPDFSQPISAGTTVLLRGSAFAGDRGVSRVEVSPDDGVIWQQATIDTTSNGLSWALWSHPWRPTQPGEHHLVVRATDGTGALQPAEQRETAPEGASGYHRVTVVVVA